MADINYVHGRVTYLNQHKAQYTLGSPVSEKAIIEFDYVILATGRDRTGPPPLWQQHTGNTCLKWTMHDRKLPMPTP